MTILPTVIALAVLFAVAAVWFRLQTVKKTVEHLEQRHGPSEGGEAVELKGRSLPPFASPDETPSRAVVVTESLIVLGYMTNLVLNFGNEADAYGGAYKDITIQIPAGTTHIVPLLTGFILMFGSLTLNPNGTIQSASISDHHLGAEALEIYVASIGSGTAVLRVEATLMDKNGDDKWTGVGYASALFLGHHP